MQGHQLSGKILFEERAYRNEIKFVREFAKPNKISNHLTDFKGLAAFLELKSIQISFSAVKHIMTEDLAGGDSQEREKDYLKKLNDH